MRSVHVFFDCDLVMVDVVPEWTKLCITWARLLKVEPNAVVSVGQRIWMDGEPYFPEQHLERVNLRQNPQALRALERFYEWLDSGSAAYADLKPFFAREWGPSCTFSVATFGDETFQKRKVASLPVPKGRFAEVYVTSSPERKGMVIAELGGADIRVLVDDNAAEHAKAELVDPSIVRIQMLRSPLMRPSPHAQHHVRDMEELTRVLLGLSA